MTESRGIARFGWTAQGVGAGLFLLILVAFRYLGKWVSVLVGKAIDRALDIGALTVDVIRKIGRASCRERV